MSQKLELDLLELLWSYVFKSYFPLSECLRVLMSRQRKFSLLLLNFFVIDPGVVIAVVAVNILVTGVAVIVIVIVVVSCCCCRCYCWCCWCCWCFWRCYWRCCCWCHCCRRCHRHRRQCWCSCLHQRVQSKQTSWLGFLLSLPSLNNRCVFSTNVNKNIFWWGCGNDFAIIKFSLLFRRLSFSSSKKTSNICCR